MEKGRKKSIQAKQQAAGWIFLAPAALLIFVMAFWPMLNAFLTSLKTGSSANMKWSEPLFNNYARMAQDNIFKTSMANTYLYLIIQVPIMLILAILLAQLLNNKHLKFRGLFRTMVFLPCAISVFCRQIFCTGMISDGLQKDPEDGDLADISPLHFPWYCIQILILQTYHRFHSFLRLY